MTAGALEPSITHDSSDWDSERVPRGTWSWLGQGVQTPLLAFFGAYMGLRDDGAEEEDKEVVGDEG